MKEKPARSLANTIVNRIIADLTDRGGLDDMWDSIEDDIRNEIEEEWNDIVFTELLGEKNEKNRFHND